MTSSDVLLKLKQAEKLPKDTAIQQKAELSHSLTGKALTIFTVMMSLAD